MRQTNRRGVAPRNENPRWPTGYEEVLRESGAQEKAIPYYLTWVRRFFVRFPGRSRRSLGRTEIAAFLQETAARAAVSNWQLAQARDALELYYEQFRGIALEPRPEYTPPLRSPSPSTVQANTVTRPHPGHSAPMPNLGPPTKRASTIPGNSRPAHPAVGAPADLRVDLPGGQTNWRALEARVRECLRRLRGLQGQPLIFDI